MNQVIFLSHTSVLAWQASGGEKLGYNYYGRPLGSLFRSFLLRLREELRYVELKTQYEGTQLWCHSLLLPMTMLAKVIFDIAIGMMSLRKLMLGGRDLGEHWEHEKAPIPG